MFINLEKGKLKLYDLRIYKRMDDIKRKLIYDSPYDKKVEENTGIWYLEGQIVNDGKDMIKFITSRDTGKWRESRDELQYPSSRIYEYEYYIFHLNEIYQILERLGNEDYKSLQILNQYINHEFDTKDQEIFEKYRNKILKNIHLVEYVSEDYQNILSIYEKILKNSNGKLSEDLKKINAHIYEMNLDGIPKKVKTSKN